MVAMFTHCSGQDYRTPPLLSITWGGGVLQSTKVRKACKEKWHTLCKGLPEPVTLILPALLPLSQPALKSACRQPGEVVTSQLQLCDRALFWWLVDTDASLYWWTLSSVASCNIGRSVGKASMKGLGGTCTDNVIMFLVFCWYKHICVHYILIVNSYSLCYFKPYPTYSAIQTCPLHTTRCQAGPLCHVWSWEIRHQYLITPVHQTLGFTLMYFHNNTVFSSQRGKNITTLYHTLEIYTIKLYLIKYNY